MAKKRIDNKNRVRNKMIGFRVSPEEWEQVEIAVSLSGLNKQNYIMSKILNREVVVQGNPRVFKALRNELAKVLSELQILNVADSHNVSEEMLDTINLITTTLRGLNQEYK